MYRLLRTVLPALVLLAAPLAAPAADYRTLEGAKPGNDPDTIEVMEFFWYGCPHCYNFAPHIAQWQANKPEGVTFTHVPAVFRPSWEIHGRAFYAARVLGVLEQFHRPMFEAMHEQGRRLETGAEMREFVDGLGLDGEEFVRTMQSFAVDAKMRRAANLQRAYGISGTPSIVIDGRYVTSGSLTGSFERMIEVINERVAASQGETG